MKPALPLPLRCILLASLLVPVVSLSFSASAAGFIVDASQSSDPDNNTYSTLEELACSGLLNAGDTVILNNDDASLTTGLTVPVNFRSADPAAPYTVDLSHLGNNPLYNLEAGDYTLEMDSVIWTNGAAGVIRTADDNVSLQITGKVQFLNNHVDDPTGDTYGGAISMRGTGLTLALGNDATFFGNYAEAYTSSNSATYSAGGAIYMVGGHATLTLGDNATFSGNYADSSSDFSSSDFFFFYSSGGAIYMEGDHVTLTLGNNATFSGNYAFSTTTTYSFSSGGAIYMRGAGLILTLGNDVTFSGNYAKSSFSPPFCSNLSYFSAGGAIYTEGDRAILILGDNATFSGNYAFSYSSCSPYLPDSAGGAIYMEGERAMLTLGDNATFSGNYAEAYTSTDPATFSAGGAIYMQGDRTMLTLGGNAIFSNNHAYSFGTSCGGAIYMEGERAMLTLGDNATFSGNYAEASYSNSYVNSVGGAICTSGNHVTLALGNNATFSGNYTFSYTSYGGAICMDGGYATLTLWDNATFSGNYAEASSYSSAPSDSSSYWTAGGAIYMQGDHAMLTLGNNATFSGNYAKTFHSSYGGAIFMEGNSSTLTLGANAIFSGNYAYSVLSSSYGGAIYMEGNSASLTIRNGATFTNNYATTYGGAIYLVGTAANSPTQFLAFTHDVLFSGNMTSGSFTQNSDGSFSVVNGVANAIHVDGTSHLQLAAAQGREVRFNDPITSAAYFSSTENVTLSLNQYTDDDGISHATDGTVIFSGELYQGDDAHLVASRYNDFKGQTTLYGGTLILEHNVVFGNAGLRDDTSMTLEHGTLEITGGSVINASSFSVANGDVVLRPGTSASINAKDVDLSHGFVFDMQKQAQEAATLANTTGLSISASGSFTLGGSIGVMDTGVSVDYLYADNSWAQQHTFIILTDSEQTHTDDFSGAHSLATGSDRVDSPYTYTGTWSHQWVDANGDGFPEQLQLVWTPGEEGGIRDILPELAGTLAMNSMWSSAANALGMSRAALGHLDALRFIAGPENNYWVKGMGDFLNHASEGARDGFDYHGGGYSVGADRKITSHAILGLGFGDLYGKMNGRSFAGDIDQQTRIGMLYGGWRKALNRKNTLLVTGTAGYGWTDNKMNSFHTGGRSHGKWTNETLFGTLTGKWSRRVNETVAMDVMLGLEYTDVTQEAFTETGWDARRFEKGHMKNLGVPVGVGLTHRSELKGREWINSAMVSYVPDVYRKNPGAQAERLFNGYRWEAQGTSPDRNAVRVSVNSALQLNARWRTYAGYEFEGRSKATAHRFNAGVSYAY